MEDGDDTKLFKSINKENYGNLSIIWVKEKDKMVSTAALLNAKEEKRDKTSASVRSGWSAD